MKNLIFFPNNINGVFVQKEYKYFKDNFNKIFVIGHGNVEEIQNLVNKYGYEFINIDISTIKIIISIIPSLFSKDLWSEIFTSISLKKGFLYKCLYTFYYQIYFSICKNTVKKILNENSQEFILYSYWLSRPAYLSAHFKNHKNVSKVISRAHGFDVFLERNKYDYIPFRKYLIETLDEIYFISMSGKNYFQKRLIDNNSYKKVPILVVSQLGTKNNNMKVSFSNSPLNIVSCSSITAVKRLDYVILLMERLNISFKWYHIGTGDMYNEIQELAEKKLPPESYQFLGYINNDEIFNVYADINPNLFVNLSDSEGIPVSIMEAISAGIPILARNVGGIPEIVDKEIGFLTSSAFDETAINQCLEFIESLNINEEYFLGLQNSCINKWADAFDSEKNYEKFFKEIKGG